MNKLLPEFVSGGLLRAFFENRTEDDIPKFPARYSMCYGNTPRQIRRLRSIGYAKANIRTIYGHNYFSRILFLRELDWGLTKLAYRRGLTQFRAYAYVTLVKPE